MGIWICLSMKLCHSTSRHFNTAGGKVRGVCKPECSMSSLWKSCCQWCSKQRPTMITICFMKPISFKPKCAHVLQSCISQWCCSNNSQHFSVVHPVFHGNKVKEPANIFLNPLMEHNADQAQAKRSQVSGLHIVSVSGSHFMSLLEKKQTVFWTKNIL